jgi:hypothetical protein
MLEPLSTTRRIELSASGLKRASMIHDPMFTIAAGSTEFHCSRFQAAFISPRISELLRSDPTIDRFVLEGVQLDSSGLRSMFEDLLQSGSFEISEASAQVMVVLCGKLLNDELSEAVADFCFSQEELDLTNCVVRFRSKNEMNVDYSEELEFIASQFYELDRSVIDDLTINELDEILSSDAVQLDSEDWLCSYLVSRGSEFSGLFSHMRYEHLSAEGIEKFISTFSWSEMNELIWRRLCSRLTHRVVLESRDLETNRQFVNRPFSESGPWSGVISYLTARCGGNVHQQGLVDITSSNNSSSCYQVADFGWTSWWASNGAANSWLQFDFKDCAIALTRYTLKSDGNSGAHYHLIQWKLEGSMDANEWEIIDHRKTEELSGPFITKMFKCSSESIPSFYRYLRLTQTRKNASGTDCLVLCNIEFFGSLRVRSCE